MYICKRECSWLFNHAVLALGFICHKTRCLVIYSSLEKPGRSVHGLFQGTLVKS
jgi:hypothetical protein